jgi:hypothetical protein
MENDRLFVHLCDRRYIVLAALHLMALVRDPPHLAPISARANDSTRGNFPSRVCGIALSEINVSVLIAANGCKQGADAVVREKTRF